jgi:hypothetical protein
LEWVTGSNDNIGSFKILRDKELLTEINTPDTLAYTDGNTKAGTIYTYEIVSVSPSGLSSVPSPAMPAKAMQKADNGKISEFKAIKTGAGIILSWKKTIENARSISLYKKEGEQEIMLLCELDPYTFSYTDNAVKPDTVYEYLLIIKNQAGIPVKAEVKVQM